VSNRTVAILASVMAAVSFVYESTTISLTVRPPVHAAGSTLAGDDARTKAALELEDGHLRVHVTTHGAALDLVVGVASPDA
jgi:hypothetical protein